MSTHPVAIRNLIANTVVDSLDAGSTNATPRLIYQTAGDVEVATLNFDGTSAFGDAASGIATANAIADDASATGNASPVTKAIAVDKDNVTILEMTAGEATGVPATEPDITLTTAIIAPGTVVNISTLTYQAPA